MKPAAHTAQVTEDLGRHVPISAAHVRKLEGFARRLRLFAKQQGTTTIGTTSYEIKVDATGYLVVAVNGKEMQS